MPKSTSTKPELNPAFNYDSEDEIGAFSDSEEIDVDAIYQSGGEGEDGDEVTSDAENSESGIESDEENLDLDVDFDLPSDADADDAEDEDEADQDVDDDDDDDNGNDETGIDDEENANDDDLADNSESGFEPESKSCHLKNLNKDFFVLEEDDSSLYGKKNWVTVDSDKRVSDNILTFYEFVRLIGIRAQQFNFGAEPLVDGIEGMHSAKMAYLEVISKMTPCIIRRKLPGKRYEEWKLDELHIIHTISDDFFVPENFDIDALMKYASSTITELTDVYPQKPKIISSMKKLNTNKTDRSDTTTKKPVAKNTQRRVAIAKKVPRSGK